MLSAVSEPKRIEPLKSFTVPPASAIPVIVGVLSLVVVSEVIKEEGALGAVVSTVKDKTEDEAEEFPAASVAVVVKEKSPSGRIDDVIEKFPLLSAVAEPKSFVPLKSFTVLLASAIPMIVGVVSFPREVFVKDEGTLGAVVSTVIDKAEEEGEVLPSVSIDIAVNK